MTEKEWRGEVLSICKYCRHFHDGGKSRYSCCRFDCSIYDAGRCKRTHDLREKAKKIMGVSK